MRKFITSLTAVATVTLAAVPALGLLQAAHAETTATATILVGDLNLSDPAQAARFNARVEDQGAALCRQIVDRRVRASLRQDECLEQVRLDVRRQLTSAQRADLRRSTAQPSMQVASR
jgi:UrcA family protein